MSDIDDELKKVQLEREKLALERERVLTTLAGSAGQVGAGAASLISSTSRTLGRNWIAIAGAALILLFAGIGVMYYFEGQERLRARDLLEAQNRAFEAARQEKIANFRRLEPGISKNLLKECPQATVKCRASKLNAEIFHQCIDFDSSFCVDNAIRRYVGNNP